jgi:hypothetical protein
MAMQMGKMGPEPSPPSQPPFRRLIQFLPISININMPILPICIEMIERDLLALEDMMDVVERGHESENADERGDGDAATLSPADPISSH